MIRKLAVLAVVIVVGVLVDLLVDAPTVARGSIIGVIGTLALTYGSIWLAGVIKRPEDYYDRQDLPAPRGGGDG